MRCNCSGAGKRAPRGGGTRGMAVLTNLFPVLLWNRMEASSELSEEAGEKMKKSAFHSAEYPQHFVK